MQVEIIDVFALLIAFQIKHLVADYVLQSKWMIIQKSASSNWMQGLASHCLVHAAFTSIIILIYKPVFIWLALVDFTLHFFVDRAKSSPNLGGKLKDNTKAAYWWIFGSDQMFHHLTHYTIIFVLLFY